MRAWAVAGALTGLMGCSGSAVVDVAGGGGVGNGSTVAGSGGEGLAPVGGSGGTAGTGATGGSGGSAGECTPTQEPPAGWDLDHPAQAADIIVSVPTIDALTGDGANNGAASSTGYFLWIGEEQGLEWIDHITGVSFDLSAIPHDAQVVEAVAHLYQKFVWGAVFTPPMERVVAEHVRFGSLWHLWGLPPIEQAMGEALVSDDPALGWRTVDLTQITRYDLASCQDKTQITLQLAPEQNNEDNPGGDYVLFCSENYESSPSPSSPPAHHPYLEIRYRLQGE